MFFGSHVSNKEILDIYTPLCLELLDSTAAWDAVFPGGAGRPLKGEKTLIDLQRNTDRSSVHEPRCSDDRCMNTRCWYARIVDKKGPTSDWIAKMRALMSSTNPSDLEPSFARMDPDHWKVGRPPYMLDATLWDPDVWTLEQLRLVKRKILVFRFMPMDMAAPDSASEHCKVLASIEQQTNVVSIFPAFFRQAIPVKEGTNIAELCSEGDAVVIHEALHSFSSIGAVDQVLHHSQLPAKDVPPRGDWLWRAKPGAQPDMVLCADWQRCRALAQLDEVHDTRMALKNTYSHEFFVKAVKAVMSNPELRLSNSGRFERRTGEHGLPELVHSSSAFECFRHPDTGRLQDQPGYIDNLDYWRCVESEELASKRKVLEEYLCIARYYSQQPDSKDNSWLAEVIPIARLKHDEEATRFLLGDWSYPAPRP